MVDHITNVLLKKALLRQYLTVYSWYILFLVLGRRLAAMLECPLQGACLSKGDVKDKPLPVQKASLSSLMQSNEKVKSLLPECG